MLLAWAEMWILNGRRTFRSISSAGQPKRRAALVMSILRGETSMQEAVRQQGLTVGEIEDRLAPAENALTLEAED